MISIVNKFFAITLIISIGFLQCGCSAFGGSRERFSVVASERDAQIFVNGELIGNGNVQTSVPRGKDVSVMVKKEGYYPATREIGTKMSFLGVLDIIGGCIILLPFFGLCFPGSHELEQTSLCVVIEKQSNK